MILYNITFTIVNVPLIYFIRNSFSNGYVIHVFHYSQKCFVSDSLRGCVCYCTIIYVNNFTLLKIKVPKRYQGTSSVHVQKNHLYDLTPLTNLKPVQSVNVSLQFKHTVNNNSF